MEPCFCVLQNITSKPKTQVFCRTLNSVLETVGDLFSPTTQQGTDTLHQVMVEVVTSVVVEPLPVA